MNMFLCDHCHKSVPINDEMAVQNRNHCPFCLYSRHVDERVPGDRKSICEGLMEPMGLTMKRSRDKYAKRPTGELMLIHRCTKCEKLNINRIAGDDNTDTILAVFAASENCSKDQQKELYVQHIHMLTKRSKKQVLTQLFGNK